MDPRLSVSFAPVVLLLSCSGGADPTPLSVDGGVASSERAAFPERPALELVTDGGALAIELRSAPYDEPRRGSNDIELLVASSDDGEPVPGLQLRMVPFMPAMGHGSRTDAEGEDLGDGRYQFSDVYLTMPGVWELRTTISGASSDYVAPSFDVR